MRWVRRLFFTLALIVLLLIAGVVVLVKLTGGDRPSSARTSVEVGGRTVTLGGYYRSSSQSATEDGIRVTVDQHEIVAARNGQVTIDGKAQQVGDFKELGIWITEQGAIETKVVPR